MLPCSPFSILRQGYAVQVSAGQTLLLSVNAKETQANTSSSALWLHGWYSICNNRIQLFREKTLQTSSAL